jgi:hypothetical protein
MLERTNGRVLMAITAWGRGLMPVSSPPHRIAHRLPKTRATKLAGSTGMPPRHARPSPPPSAGYTSNIKPDGHGQLKGRTSRVFSYTRVQRLLTHWFNWLNTYEIGVILVVYEDVFIVDLQCAMTRPEIFEMYM